MATKTLTIYSNDGNTQLLYDNDIGSLTTFVWDYGIIKYYDDPNDQTSYTVIFDATAYEGLALVSGATTPYTGFSITDTGTQITFREGNGREFYVVGLEKSIFNIKSNDGTETLESVSLNSGDYISIVNGVIQKYDSANDTTTTVLNLRASGKYLGLTATQGSSSVGSGLGLVGTTTIYTATSTATEITYYVVDSPAVSLANLYDFKEKVVDLSSAQTITGVKTIGLSNSYTPLKFSITGQYRWQIGVILGNSFDIARYSGDSLQYGYNFSNTGFSPKDNNQRDLGSSTYKWKYLYLSGKINPNSGNYGLSLPDTSSWTANKEIATTDYFWVYATNSTTQLEYSYINNMSLSANTTLTLATAPANSYPEYKANITNTDTSNAITITLPSGTSIKGNVSISSNTFEIPADSSVELSLQNQKAIVISW